MDNLLIIILSSIIGMLVGIISVYFAFSSSRIKTRQDVLGELYCFYSTRLGHIEYINSIKFSNSQNNRKPSSKDMEEIAREEDRLQKTNQTIGQLESKLSKQYVCFIPRVAIPIYWPSLASGLSILIMMVCLCSVVLR